MNLKELEAPRKLLDDPSSLFSENIATGIMQWASCRRMRSRVLLCTFNIRCLGVDLVPQDGARIRRVQDVD